MVALIFRSEDGEFPKKKKKCPWSHAVISMTESILLSILCCLRVRRSHIHHYWFLPCPFYRDVSWFSESFDDLMYCRWSIIRRLHNFTFRSVGLKLRLCLFKVLFFLFFKPNPVIAPFPVSASYQQVVSLSTCDVFYVLFEIQHYSMRSLNPHILLLFEFYASQLFLNLFFCRCMLWRGLCL